jgi:hypothetical protein
VSLWTCLKCTARYAVGLAACPQCQSSEHSDDPNYTPPVPAEQVAETAADAQSGTKAGSATAVASAPEPADLPTQDGGKP